MIAASRIAKARSRLVMEQPFFGCLALNLELIEAPHVSDTMATDGRALFYAPDFVATLSDAQIMGVVAHEVMHCAYAHHVRLGARDLETFNRAADYAINGDLIAAGFILPDGILVDPKFTGRGAEEIYAVLHRAKQEQAAQEQAAQSGQTGQDSGASQGQGQGKSDQAQSGQPGAGAGQPGQGNGQGQPGAADSAQAGQGQPGTGQSQPGASNGQPGQSGAAGAPSAGQPGAHGMGGVIAPANASSSDIEAEKARWQVMTRQAVNIAKAHNAGTVPGYLSELVRELAAPVKDWRDELADWLDSRVSTDSSFMRPNRRFIGAGLYLPGPVVDGLEHVIFIVDTSGSITAPMIKGAASEIIGAMESGKFARLTVLMADTAVRHVQEFELGDDIELEAKGGGGTRFSDSFRWIAENAPDASAVIYLTDLEVSDFGQEPDCPVLWATHGDSRAFDRRAANVPFGQPIYIGQL